MKKLIICIIGALAVSCTSKEQLAKELYIAEQAVIHTVDNTMPNSLKSNIEYMKVQESIKKDKSYFIKIAVKYKTKQEPSIYSFTVDEYGHVKQQ